MKRFADSRAENVWQTGFSDEMPSHVAHRAHWLIHLLLAASSLQDVAAIGAAKRVKNSDRFMLPVEGRWHLTFQWVLEMAVEIGLERC